MPRLMYNAHDDDCFRLDNVEDRVGGSDGAMRGGIDDERPGTLLDVRQLRSNCVRAIGGTGLEAEESDRAETQLLRRCRGQLRAKREDSLTAEELVLNFIPWPS